MCHGNIRETVDQVSGGAHFSHDLLFTVLGNCFQRERERETFAFDCQESMFVRGNRALSERIMRPMSGEKLKMSPYRNGGRRQLESANVATDG